MPVRTINIEDISVGLELAQPITNKKGQQILPSGTIILKNHIVLFQKLGLEFIEINTYETESVTEFQNEKEIDPVEMLKERIDWSPILEQEADLINIALQNILEKKG